MGSLVVTINRLCFGHPNYYYRTCTWGIPSTYNNFLGTNGLRLTWTDYTNNLLLQIDNHSL